jgi:hypothetical protein
MSCVAYTCDLVANLPDRLSGLGLGTMQAMLINKLG